MPRFSPGIGEPILAGHEATFLDVLLVVAKFAYLKDLVAWIIPKNVLSLVFQRWG